MDEPPDLPGAPWTRWQPSDLDFPVLVLTGAEAGWEIGGYGGDPQVGLSSVDVCYGGTDETLRLETRARRGCRTGPGGPRWQADHLPAVAGEAVTSLLLRAVRSDDPEERHARADRAVDLGRRLAADFPGPPWQAREALVDGVPFALWFCRRDEGFAGALDLGPVVVLAVGDDVDAWDWTLTALAPDDVRAHLVAFDTRADADDVEDEPDRPE